MKLKSKIIFFICALIASLFIAKISSSPDSALNWYIETTKSELWAISQQFQLNSESSDSKILQLDRETTTPQIMTAKIARNRSEPISYGFPLGWYDSVDNLNTPAQIINEGINVVVPYTGNKNISQVKAYLDRAAAAGIKVVVEIPRDEVRKDHRWLITQFVKQLKHHPAVYGWYLYDEPEYVKISPKLLERVYRAIKTEDPEHSVAMAFGRLIHIRKYLKALDAVMYFKYPLYYDTPEFSGLENGVFRKQAETAAFIVGNRKQFWFVLQGYGEDKYGNPTKFNRRLPTVAEEKYMVYTAILAEADGLFFWTHYLSQQKWIDSVLTPIIGELKDYLPAITNGKLNTGTLAKEAYIQANLYRDPISQNLLLIAINHSDSKLKTAIAIEGDIKAQSAQVIAENRFVDLAQKILTDTFEPYAVHIYQLE